jgi:hypothetical protein
MSVEGRAHRRCVRCVAGEIRNRPRVPSWSISIQRVAAVQSIRSCGAFDDQARAQYHGYKSVDLVELWSIRLVDPKKSKVCEHAKVLIKL